MSANVETMMYVREKPWHGLGTKVESAPTSADALRLAGLDWTVDPKPVYVDGNEIPGYVANVRSSDNSCLGIVSNRYKVVQNAEAFSFTDNLIGGEVHYETAGSLRGGKKIWLLAQLPEREICGDKTEPYMVFSNAHDGTGAITVCMTPVRVVCNNTLNFALRTAKRSWSVRHMGDISEKLSEAHRCLDMADDYMGALAVQADRLANKTVTSEQLQELLSEMFPVNDDMTDRQKRHVQELKDEYMVCYFAPDIAKFQGTAWGVVNAMSDMVTHTMPHRNTKGYAENNWGRIMNGHWLIDNLVAKVL